MAKKATKATKQSLNQDDIQLYEEPTPAFPQEEESLPIEKALILASCIGAIKDPITGGPMREEDFRDVLPRFIDQAYTLYYNVLRTVEAAEKRFQEQQQEKA